MIPARGFVNLQPSVDPTQIPKFLVNGLHELKMCASVFTEYFKIENIIVDEWFFRAKRE